MVNYTFHCIRFIKGNKNEKKITKIQQKKFAFLFRLFSPFFFVLLFGLVVVFISVRNSRESVSRVFDNVISHLTLSSMQKEREFITQTSNVCKL